MFPYGQLLMTVCEQDPVIETGGHGALMDRIVILLSHPSKVRRRSGIACCLWMTSGLSFPPPLTECVPSMPRSFKICCAIASRVTLVGKERE